MDSDLPFQIPLPRAGEPLTALAAPWTEIAAVPWPALLSAKTIRRNRGDAHCNPRAGGYTFRS